MINDVSYIANTPDQRYPDDVETESEAETEKGNISKNTNDVRIEVENAEDILVSKLHEYIMRNHRSKDKGFTAEFNVRMIFSLCCYFCLYIIVFSVFL